MEESKAVPIREIKRVIEVLPYACTARVIFQMLAYTGCRISELDSMSWSLVKDNWLYWKLGKNQGHYRKIKLPDVFVEELKAHRHTHKVEGDKLFCLSGESFRRYFNRYVRFLVGGEWLEKTDTVSNGFFVPEFKLQLKGLRKTYQTLLFRRELDKWKDAGVALQFTSKEMRHSSERITAYHYLVNFDRIGADRISVVEDLSRLPVQRKLVEFLE